MVLIIVALYAWNYFGTIPSALQHYIPSLFSLSVALTAGLYSLVAYFTTKTEHLTLSTKLSYLFGSLLVMSLIMGGSQDSPYLPLAVLALGFAPIFGKTITISAAIFSLGYVAFLLVTEMPLPEVYAHGAALIIPLIIGLIAWGRGEGVSESTSEDRAYHELATELSQVSGKSEVVINAIGDGVIALDGQGVVQLINPAAERLLGWGNQDAINLSYLSVLKLFNSQNEPIDESQSPIADTLLNNKPSSSDDVSIETQSGKKFLAYVSVSPVGQAGSGAIVIFRDITTEKSDERQRAEFISTASHEMRTPVASIEGYLGLALNPATAQIDPKAREFITKAHESAQHLGRLFQDLLDVSKADDGRIQNNPTVVDVVPFIRDIVEGLTPKATEKGLAVYYKPITAEKTHESRRINPVYYANVDNDHLREVVSNLLENAIKYTLQGEVVVDVTGDEKNLVISVTDSGIGIPKEDQSHLFQKFYRVDNSDTREIGGTGLGLYLCRRLAETMGGRIWVESEYKKGSTFFLEIPRTPHEEATQLIEQASLMVDQESAAPEPISIDSHELSLADLQQPELLTPAIITPEPEVYTQPLTPPPSPMPTYAPQPTPPTPAPSATPLSYTNTPLSTIEANPAQYITRTTAPNRQLNIPER